MDKSNQSENDNGYPICVLSPQLSTKDTKSVYNVLKLFRRNSFGIFLKFEYEKSLRDSGILESLEVFPLSYALAIRNPDKNTYTRYINRIYDTDCIADVIDAFNMEDNVAIIKVDSGVKNSLILSTISEFFRVFSNTLNYAIDIGQLVNAIDRTLRNFQQPQQLKSGIIIIFDLNDPLFIDDNIKPADVPTISIDLFANNLRRILKNRKITISELCDKAGISRQALNNYLSAKTLPRLDILPALAKVLNVSFDDLLMPSINPNFKSINNSYSLKSDFSSISRDELTTDQIAIIQNLISEFRKLNVELSESRKIHDQIRALFNNDGK